MELSELNISPKKEKQFNSKKIYSVEDLQAFFPIGYMDYRTVSCGKSITEPGKYLLHGRIVNKIGYNGSTCCVKVITDDGEKLSVRWFSNSYEFKLLKTNESYYFGGNVSFFNDELSMVVPEVLTKNEKEALRIMPRYSSIKGMSKDYLTEKLKLALDEVVEISDHEFLSRDLNLMPYKEAVEQLHKPDGVDEIKKAKYRVAADEMVTFYRNLKDKEHISSESKMKIKDISKAVAITKGLPFSLTESQRKALTSIKTDLLTGNRINTLLLGDVGSGKTIVAVITACMAAENGYQVVILSPTQILARQTYDEAKKYLEPVGIKVGYIDASFNKKDRKSVQNAVLSGEIAVMVGTHSLISDSFEYNNLGLLITDEEHKFGVGQKEALTKREDEGIGLLSMSATPIPRSLALTLYGASTKVLTMTQPSERQKIDTRQEMFLSDVYSDIVKEVSEGHQVYVVCPFVEDSDAEGFSDISSAEELYKTLRADLFTYGIEVGVVTGAMKSEDADSVISRFANNDIKVLVATTIIEVGVNVPNATLMIIKNAERFGLAQLHQLRGRVGRGKAKSRCILVSDKDTERLDVLCKTNDGFEIAEEDMKLRGPGKLTGIKQSGYSKDVELILKYPKLSAKIKEIVYSE